MGYYSLQISSTLNIGYLKTGEIWESAGWYIFLTILQSVNQVSYFSHIDAVLDTFIIYLSCIHAIKIHQLFTLFTMNSRLSLAPKIQGWAKVDEVGLFLHGSYRLVEEINIKK